MFLAVVDVLASFGGVHQFTAVFGDTLLDPVLAQSRGPLVRPYVFSQRRGPQHPPPTPQLLSAERSQKKKEEKLAWLTAAAISRNTGHACCAAVVGVAVAV